MLVCECTSLWRLCIFYSKDILPGSPLKQIGASIEDKAELITLPIPNDDVRKITYDILSTAIHQPEGALIIGFPEPMILSEPAQKHPLFIPAPLTVTVQDNTLVKASPIQPHNYPGFRQTSVIHLESLHVLILGLGHSCPSGQTVSPWTAQRIQTSRAVLQHPTHHYVAYTNDDPIPTSSPLWKNRNHD